MFVAGLCLACHNLVLFMMSDTQTKKCKKLHPMFIFYLWIILDFVFNIVWLIYVVKASSFQESNQMVYILFLPATFKILIGIEQIWLMIELIAHIDLGMRILKGSSCNSTDNLTDSVLFPSREEEEVQESKILCGRMITTAISAVFLLTILICCAIMAGKPSNAPMFIDLGHYVFPAIICILFIALLVCVFILMTKLRQESKILAQNDEKEDYFRKEINTLGLILFAFSISYLLRFFFDVIFGFKGSGFTVLMLDVWSGIPFDIIPIYIILLLHRKNLRDINVFTMEQEVRQFDSDCPDNNTFAYQHATDKSP